MTICFETCIVLTGNIQWEVTHACSALRAPYVVHINPKTHNHSPEITGRSCNRGKQIDQRDSVLETSHVPFDHHYCADMPFFFFFLAVRSKNFSLIVSVQSIRYDLTPIYLSTTVALCAQHAAASRDTCKWETISKWGKTPSLCDKYMQLLGGGDVRK